MKDGVMKEFKVLSPTAILGYGFPEESFMEAMDQQPDAIAVDAGSTDPGPYYLGAGVPFTDRNAVKRDVEIMLKGALASGIPLLIGSAGGCGAKPHVDLTKEIIEEIAKENGLAFWMAVIYSDYSKNTVLDALKNDRLSPLTPAPQATQEDILESTYIVGQMGPESFIGALDGGAQVILAGRSYDPSMFAAPAIRKGFDVALALHMGKILECACIAATPGSGSDCMMGKLGEDYFDLWPVNASRKCTVTSVAAHTLYEKTNPYILPGPGGRLLLDQCTFEQIGERTVRVRGSRFEEESEPTVKIEAAKPMGYRTFCIAGTRDPIMIERIEHIAEEIKGIVGKAFPDAKYKIDFKFYGKNAIMGDMEKNQEFSHELGILIDVVAKTQEWADTICSFTRSTMLHYGYEERISTAGNLAFPYSPSDVKVGKVYQFSLYHLIRQSGHEFRINMERIGKDEL